VFKINAVWTQYPRDVYEALRKSYMIGDEIVELVIVSDPDVPHMRYYTKYFVDWAKQEQMNAFTNKARKIRLISKEEGQESYPIMKGALARIKTVSSIPMTVFFPDGPPPGGEYKRKADDCHRIVTKLNNEWTCYNDDILHALQNAYVDGHDIVEFVLLSNPEVAHMKFYSKYIVDFTEMTQANAYTDKSRAIRFLKKQDKTRYEVSTAALAKDVTALMHLNGASKYHDLGKSTEIEKVTWDSPSTKSRNLRVSNTGDARSVSKPRKKTVRKSKKIVP